jgi:hypothetical protein
MNLLYDLSVTISTGYLWTLPVAVIWYMRDQATPRARLVLEAMQILLAISGVMQLSLAVWELGASFWWGKDAEQFAVMNRYFGPYATLFWMRILLQLVLPQLLWWRRVRLVPAAALAIWLGQWASIIFFLLGMAGRDYLASSWVVWSLPWMTGGWIVYFALVAFLAWWRKKSPGIMVER